MMMDPRIMIKPDAIMGKEDGPPTLVLNELSQSDIDSLSRQFAHHPPTGRKGERHDAVRTHLRNAAVVVTALCPESSERDEAVKALRLAMFHANAAIACNPEVGS